MNIEKAIEVGIEQLQDNQDRVDAKVDSEFLLSFVLDKNFTWLKTWPEYELDETQQKNYLALLARRKQGEPIAYITGSKGFWTLQLDTNSSTLIPRAETELLVEKALEFLADKSVASVLDLGTGTGAIALSIAAERPNDQVFACDFSQQAVLLAQANQRKHHIQNVEIFQSDWFSKVKANQFDLIVANPPYIEEDDPHLEQGDLIFEPQSALVSADQGFADLILIIKQAKQFLKPNGCLMLEHGFTQASKLRQIFADAGYQQVKTVEDLSALDRVTLGIWR